jgi:hypothetical protein
LILNSVQLLAGDPPAHVNLEDGHGMPLLELRAGPDEPSPATGKWRSDHGGRQVSGVGVRLTGRGAVLFLEVEPAPDPARDRTPRLVVRGKPPPERTYRNPHPELNDTSTATMRYGASCRAVVSYTPSEFFVGSKQIGALTVKTTDPETGAVNVILIPVSGTGKN